MQVTEILNHSKKIKSIDDLINNLDLVIEVAKEDVLKMASSRKLYFHDFDYSYSQAANILKSQLKKKHLKAINKFYKCEVLGNAIKWLISRLLNNMVNITTNKKYKLYSPHKVMLINEDTKEDFDSFKLIETLDFNRLDKNILLKGLRQIWSESLLTNDFDKNDLKILCDKCNIQINEVIDNKIEVFIKKGDQAGSCNFQLVLNFD